MRRLADGASIWAYGAAGKATMWVNACEMDYLEAVVDASPLRAGKLMPGTHTPIVGPEEFRRHQPDYVFASAWNYLDAIRANEPRLRAAAGSSRCRRCGSTDASEPAHARRGAGPRARASRRSR